MGGYFLLNGIERIIRLLIQQRRHYIMGMVRSAYARRGPTFSGAQSTHDLPRTARLGVLNAIVFARVCNCHPLRGARRNFRLCSAALLV